MAKRSETADAQLLSNSLDSWANANGNSNDFYVKALQAALISKRNWSMWASLDPLDFLPEPRVSGNNRLIRINYILTIIRNGLVFTPVALTWLAISNATRAFAEYTTKNSNGVANFLDFWQKGYGILNKEWSIGNVAFVDFLLILLIIGLTVTTTIIGRNIQESRARKLIELDRDRMAMALEISEFFFDKKLVTNVTMNQSLANAIRDLNSSSKLINNSTLELNKTIKSLPKYKELVAEIKNIKLNLAKRNRDSE